MAAASYYQLDSYPPQTSSNQPFNGPQNAPHSQSQRLSNIHNSTDSVYQPLNSDVVKKPNHDPSSRLAQSKYLSLKRYLRIAKALSNALTLLFTAIIFALMVYTSIKYMTTKNIIRSGRGPWAKNPKVWPTIMLLVASGITLLLSIITLLSYCFCFDKASWSWKLTVVKYTIHILAWIVVSVLYRYEKGLHGNNNDLWGWACSQEASAIQDDFKGVVDFTSLCRFQSNSWGVSITELVFKTAFAVVQFWLHRKTRKGEKQKFVDRLGGASTGFLDDTTL